MGNHKLSLENSLLKTPNPKSFLAWVKRKVLPKKLLLINELCVNHLLCLELIILFPILKLNVAGNLLSK